MHRLSGRVHIWMVSRRVIASRLHEDDTLTGRTPHGPLLSVFDEEAVCITSRAIVVLGLLTLLSIPAVPPMVPVCAPVDAIFAAHACGMVFMARGAVCNGGKTLYCQLPCSDP